MDCFCFLSNFFLLFLQYAFRAGQVITPGIPRYSHADRFGKCLKNRFNLMMFIVATALDIQIALAASLNDLKK